MKPPYILIKTHQIVFNVKPKPDDESMFYKRHSEGMSWGDYLLKDWQSSHQTAEYANEEEREKILEVIEDYYWNERMYSADGFENDLDSGIVYTGDRIRIEEIIDAEKELKENKFWNPKLVAYLSEVKEEKEKWEKRKQEPYDAKGVYTNHIFNSEKEEKETNKAVEFAEWIGLNEYYMPITAGNVPKWFGKDIKSSTTEELYEIFLTRK